LYSFWFSKNLNACLFLCTTIFFECIATTCALKKQPSTFYTHFHIITIYIVMSCFTHIWNFFVYEIVFGGISIIFTNKTMTHAIEIQNNVWIQSFKKDDVFENIPIYIIILSCERKKLFRNVSLFTLLHIKLFVFLQYWCFQMSFVDKLYFLPHV